MGNAAVDITAVTDDGIADLGLLANILCRVKVGVGKFIDFKYWNLSEFFEKTFEIFLCVQVIKLFSDSPDILANIK